MFFSRRRQRLSKHQDQHNMEWTVDCLERRILLTADAIFAITDVGDSPLHDASETSFADWRCFQHSDDLHPSEDQDGLVAEPFLEEPGSSAESPGDSVLWESYDLSQTFQLHSLSGADHTIYLDFDGHETSGTIWNSSFNAGATITTPAYNFSGDASSFSDSELTRIQRIWARVAEDFAPFNVNVTTQDPGADANAGIFTTFHYNAIGMTPDRIRLVYANDAGHSNGQVDNALRIDSITIDGVTYQAESTDVLSTGTWHPKTDFVPVLGVVSFCIPTDFFSSMRVVSRTLPKHSTAFVSENATWLSR